MCMYAGCTQAAYDGLTIAVAHNTCLAIGILSFQEASGDDAGALESRLRQCRVLQVGLLRVSLRVCKSWGGRGHIHLA